MASDNRRYLTLRKKLDDLNFVMHLDEGSVPLVEKLIAELARLSEHVHTLKKQQQNSQSQQSMSRASQEENDYKFDLLNKQYHQLLEEHNRLKVELSAKNSSLNEESDRRIKAIRDKYDSKISELTEKLVRFEKEGDKMGGDRQELMDRIDSLLQENDQLSQANRKTERMYVEALQQCDSLKLQLKEAFECEKNVERGKLQELEALLQKKSAQIQQLQENELTQNAKLKALTREMEAIEGEKRRSMLESKGVASVSETLKTENRQLEKTNTRLSCEIQQLNRELDGLRKTKSHLETELYRYKEQEVSIQSTTQSSELAKNRLEMLYEGGQQELLKRRQELDDLKYQLDQQQKDGQRQEDKIRELSSKNAMLLKNINELQTELDLVSGKLSAKLRENRELDTAKGLLERQVRELEVLRQQQQQSELIAKERQQADQLQLQDSKQRKNIELQGRIYEEEIDIMRENEKALVIRNEKLQSDLKRLEIVVGNGTKQLELVNTQKEALMREIGELKEALTATKTSDHSSKTSSIKLQQRLNSMEVLNQDLRTTLQEESRKVKQLHEEVLRLQAEITQKEAKAIMIFSENAQLSQRCEALEATKCELFEKMKLMASHRSETEEEKLAVSQDFRAMGDRLAQMELELHRKNAAMLAIDEERDSMQNVLDVKTEENAQLKMRVEQLEGTMKKYNRELDTKDFGLHGLQTRLAGIEAENEHLKKQLERTTLELQGRLSVSSKLEAQVNTLTNERNIMAMGQRDTNRQLEQMKAAYNDLQRRFKELMKERDESREQELRMKITHEDMLTNMQANVTEIARLEQLIIELESANNDMYNMLHESQTIKAELNQNIVMANQQITQYCNEIASYERQLGLLGSQLGIKEQELRRVSAERDNYRFEQSRVRQPSELRATFEERLTLLQQELELKRRECESLRQTKWQLEKVIESERANNFVLARQLNQQRTPIKAIMSQSMMDSNVENSSIHANSTSRPQMHLQDSFESRGSICSHKLKERIQQIEKQYANTYIRNKK